ncbi:esterase-like activity of phytase family protein [Allostreptomyces psammosilenae]|uniref:Phytase-like domain-containing protein n=1 Tax=Allostreptomyces psammosilenae TaxID=1892865 RepID=A0A853A4L5_9ACTN|nr:esterase-like activity of phytase family protein [Allostreptomyces psammosilenae]NYI05641.1 hypothetical protein [Allostreptomyces psammosilenae]
MTRTATTAVAAAVTATLLAAPATAGPSATGPSATGPSAAGPSAAGSAPTALPGVPAAGRPWFQRQATWPVHLQDGGAADAPEQTAAEISAATEDGRTVVYTDSPAGRIGLVDLRRVDAPRPLGTLDMGGEPTSVDVIGNRWALVAVNTSESFTRPSGVLRVVDLTTRTVVADHDLGGQPDSVDLSPDGRYAAIAVENERDEDAGDGGLPQAPGGWLAVLDVTGPSPDRWSVRRVALDGLAEIAPGDPEPEYVSVNARHQAVVTLQENNHIAVVDLPTGRVVRHFSAGTAHVTGVDTVTDGAVRPDGEVTAAREPDGVAWLDDHYVATADEGDWRGGSRTWTVFDTRTGTVVWDSGAELEDLAIRYGQYPEDRAGKKGVEPENIAVATFHGTRYAFVGLERANLVAVYDVDDPRRPRLVQGLPAGVAPEGLLPLPGRDALVVSAEEDSAEDAVRSSLTTYRWTRASLPNAAARNQAAPTIVSADGPGGAPVGFGALSGLTGLPGRGNGDTLVAVTDNAYAPTRLLTVDTTATPAVVTGEVPVTRDGAPASYDAEGVAARPEGGYWLASEGDGADTANLLVRLDAAGRVLQEVPLPADVAADATRYGFEGVTVLPNRSGGAAAQPEQVWVAVQRPWHGSATTMLARYTPSTGAWAYLAYPLETAPDGGWGGVSELTALDSDTLLVLERDNQRGAAAEVKRVYRVDLGDLRPAASPTDAPTVTKRLVDDLLPRLTAGGGTAHDKPEGMAVTADGQLLVAIDNDGLDDAPGESALLRLGPAPRR